MASGEPAGTSWIPRPAQDAQEWTSASPWAPVPLQRVQGRVRARSEAPGIFVTPWHLGQLRVPLPSHFSQGRVPRIGLPLQTSQVLWPVAPTPTVIL